MTVQKLIEQLQQIEDKTKEVWSYADNDYWPVNHVDEDGESVCLR